MYKLYLETEATFPKRKSNFYYKLSEKEKDELDETINGVNKGIQAIKDLNEKQNKIYIPRAIEAGRIDVKGFEVPHGVKSISQKNQKEMSNMSNKG